MIRVLSLVEPMAHMDASLHEVALVSATSQRNSSSRCPQRMIHQLRTCASIDTGAGVINADHRGILYLVCITIQHWRPGLRGFVS